MCMYTSPCHEIHTPTQKYCCRALHKTMTIRAAAHPCQDSLDSCCKFPDSVTVSMRQWCMPKGVSCAYLIASCRVLFQWTRAVASLSWSGEADHPCPAILSWMNLHMSGHRSSQVGEQPGQGYCDVLQARREGSLHAFAGANENSVKPHLWGRMVGHQLHQSSQSR